MKIRNLISGLIAAEKLHHGMHVMAKEYICLYIFLQILDIVMSSSLYLAFNQFKSYKYADDIIPLCSFH